MASKRVRASSARDVLIVGAARSPFGSINGQMSGWHPAAMASLTISGLLERSSADPATIETVVLGCASQVGAQSMNVARAAALGAALPDHVAAATIDCGGASSIEAVRLAAGLLRPGVLAIAGGLEHMTQVPLGLVSFDEGFGDVHGPEVKGRFRSDGGLQPPGVVAERIAKQAGLSRGDLETYSTESRRRFILAQKDGRLGPEVIESMGNRGQTPLSDEVITTEADFEPSALLPCFLTDGVLTSPMVAPPADGAAMLLLSQDATCRSLGLNPRARIVGATSVGSNPVNGSLAAKGVTIKLLSELSLEIADMDIFEIHEAFAPIPLAWSRSFGVESQRCNLNGGALSLGDPLGASGARLALSALNQLECAQKRFALVVSERAEGFASAMVIERL